MDGYLFDYDTICDHWGESRGDRGSDRHICNDRRDAHRMLGNLHRLQGKTKMAFIIAIAIYDGGIDVAVPTFLLGLVVWYGVLFESGLADADDILGI